MAVADTSVVADEGARLIEHGALETHSGLAVSAPDSVDLVSDSTVRLEGQ